MPLPIPPWFSPPKFHQKDYCQKSHYGQTRWLTPAVIALGLMIANGNLKAEETFDVDWSILAGSSVPQEAAPDSRIGFVSKLSPGSIFTGPATEPPNPFPDSESSLYVIAENPADPWFRLLARPFVDESATEGVLEFEFRLIAGTLNFSFGHCDQPYLPGNLATYTVSDLIFNASFAVDRDVRISGRAYQTSSITSLNSGETYRFMIKWDRSTPEGFSCFLNGEPLTPVSGGLGQIFSEAAPDTGFNAFRITLGGSKDHLGSFFLGRIMGRSAPVDLLSSDGLIEK